MADVSNLPEWYVNEDKGPTIVATICSITAVATVFVAARLFVKGHMLRSLTIDDWVMVVSLIFGWMAVGFSVAAVRAGDGRHIETLTLDQISDAVLWTMIGFFPSILSIAIPKFAVVTLLIRLLNVSKRHQRFLWFIVTVSMFVLCGCMVILYAQCHPTRSQWDFSIKDKTCWSPWILIDYSRTASVVAGCVDLYLAIYPMFVLYGLQLNWKKKTALSVALGIGVAAAVAAFYKATTLAGLASHDFTWDTCSLTMWTCIEGGTIIIAACIPLLQPLLDLVLGRRSLTSHGGSDKYSGKYVKQGSSRDTPLPGGGPGGAGGGSHHHHELSSLGGSSTKAGGGGAGGGPMRHGRRMGKSDIDTSILVTNAERSGSEESILPVQKPGTASTIEEGGVMGMPAAGRRGSPPDPMSAAEAGMIVPTSRRSEGQIRQQYHKHQHHHSQPRSSSQSSGGRIGIAHGGGPGEGGGRRILHSKSNRSSSGSSNDGSSHGGDDEVVNGHGKSRTSDRSGIIKTHEVRIEYDENLDVVEQPTHGMAAAPGHWKAI